MHKCVESKSQEQLHTALYHIIESFTFSIFAPSFFSYKYKGHDDIINFEQSQQHHSGYLSRQFTQLIHNFYRILILYHWFVWNPFRCHGVRFSKINYFSHNLLCIPCDLLLFDSEKVRLSSAKLKSRACLWNPIEFFFHFAFNRICECSIRLQGKQEG